MKYYSFLIESKINPIEQMRKNIDLFKNDKKGNNCQRFTAALECLIQTGNKIIPKITPTPLEQVFDVPAGYPYPYANWCLMKHGKPLKFKGKSIEFVKNNLVENNSRLIISVSWKNSSSGHVFNAWRNDRDVYIIDAMCGYMDKIENCGRYLNDIDPTESFVVQCREGDIDSELKEKTFNNNKKTWKYTLVDSKGTINKTEFKSILFGLNAIGKKNEIYTIYENSKKLGKIKVLNLIHEWKNYWKLWSYTWI